MSVTILTQEQLIALGDGESVQLHDGFLFGDGWSQRELEQLRAGETVEDRDEPGESYRVETASERASRLSA